MKEYDFAPSVGDSLRRACPSLDDLDLPLWALRQWLRLHSVTSMELAMPSHAIDLLWHDFILDTKEYASFCDRAYGHLLHHRPARSMSVEEVEDLNGRQMAETFAFACRDQKIDPYSAHRLPILFSIDEEVQVPEGQIWRLSCDERECTATSSFHCVKHELGPVLPSKLPRLRSTAGTGSVANCSSGGGSCGGGHGCGGHGCGGHG